MNIYWQVILTVIVTLVGAVLQAGFGFGIGPVLVAFLPMIMEYNQAILTFLVLAIIGNAVLAFKYIKYVRWKALLPILIPTIVLTDVIAFFAVDINTDIIYMALGFLLIILSIYFFIFAEKIKIKASVFTGTIVGIISGILSGFFALAGPPAALYFLPALKDKKEYIGTFQMYFLIINISNLIVRLVRGGWSTISIPVMSSGIIALLIGTLIGYLCLKNFKGKWFERAVYILIGLNGLWIVISSLL